MEYHFSKLSEGRHETPQKSAFLVKDRSFAYIGRVYTQTIFRKHCQLAYRVEIRPT